MVGFCSDCKKVKEIAPFSFGEKLCKDCVKERNTKQDKDTSGIRKKGFNSHGKKVFQEPTTPSIVLGKQCAMCGEEFKKGEKTVNYLGEYPVHKRCEHGYKGKI